MAMGFGVLALSPAAFWAMTPRELAAAMRGRLGPPPAGPPSRNDLATLIARYPDR
ncbi:MAG: phage tail assembly chaperone [Hyphomicrobium sp.]